MSIITPNSKWDWTCSSSTELTLIVSEVLLIFLCRHVPATNIVLALNLFSTILLSVVHCATLPTLAWRTWFKAPGADLQSTVTLIVVSSSYMSTAECSSIFGRSFTNIRNKTGPSILPWGTPRFASLRVEWHPWSASISFKHRCYFSYFSGRWKDLIWYT